jgi:GntR family transcriptional regulator
MDTDTNDRPLWRQVLDDLEDRIATGDIGDRFPTDRELVDHYDVSRHTVREAVRHLKARGIIQRERGRGSFVRHVDVAQEMGTLFSLFREVEARGMHQASRVLGLGWATDAAAAGRLGLPARERLVHLERLRLADDEPLALDSIWLPGDVGEAVLDVDFEHTALYDELERLQGLRMDAGTEVVSAVAPSREVAEVLDLAPDEALLRIERIGRVAGRTVECRVTLVRGSRFALVSELSSDSDRAAPTVELDGHH